MTRIPSKDMKLIEPNSPMSYLLRRGQERTMNYEYQLNSAKNEAILKAGNSQKNSF